MTNNIKETTLNIAQKYLKRYKEDNLSLEDFGNEVPNDYQISSDSMRTEGFYSRLRFEFRDGSAIIGIREENADGEFGEYKFVEGVPQRRIVAPFLTLKEAREYPGLGIQCNEYTSDDWLED